MTEQQAAREIRKLPPQDVRVGLWLTGYRVFFPSERKRETAEHDLLMLQPFIRAHGRKLLSAVTPLMAQEWALKHPTQLRYLLSAYDKAVIMQIVPVNVWRCVQLPRKAKEGRPVPSVEQLDAIIERARAKRNWMVEFADIIEFAAFTGARLGGVATLETDAVDLAARRVRLREKGGKEREVVVLPRALAPLERAMVRASERPHSRFQVFATARSHKLDRRYVGDAWKRVRGDFAGPFHSLKHFAATWLLAQGVDERDIAIQLGHTDRQGRPYTQLVRRVYAHPDHSQALERIDRMVAS